MLDHLRNIAQARLAFGIVLSLCCPLATATNDERTPRTQVDAPSQELQALLTTPRGSLPSPEALTVQLLEAGPARVAAFLRQLESEALRVGQSGDDTSDLAAIGSRLRKVPGLISRTLQGTDVPGPMRNVGISVALEILGRDPRAESMKLVAMLVPMADPEDGAGMNDVAARLKLCARALASARVGTVAETADFIRGVKPSLALSFIDGIAGAKSAPYAALRLIALLDRIEGFEGALLNRIEGVARRRAVSLTVDQCSAVRRRLRSGNAFVRREAAFATGSLGDHGAITDLIELLEDPTNNVRNAAHDSLCRLTSMTISADPFRWRLWFDRQEKWWRERGQNTVASIPGAQLGDLIDLISEASTKRLYRDEVAAALMELLDHRDDRYIELGLSGLGTIRAPMSVEAIRTFTASTNPRLAARASDALRALKGAGIDTAASLRGPASRGGGARGAGVQPRQDS